MKPLMTMPGDYASGLEKGPAAHASSHLLKQPVAWTISFAFALFGFWRYWGLQAYRHIGFDESIYIYIGWAWTKGAWPYVSSWDHKGPFIFATTALRALLLDYSVQAIAWQEVVLGLATATVLAALAHRLWRGYSGALAFGLCAVLWAQVDPDEGFHQTPALLIGLFSSAAIAAVIASIKSADRKKAGWMAAIAGVCSGLVYCTKPTAVVAIVVCLAAILWAGEAKAFGERLKLALLMLVGFVTPILIFVVVFARAGALGAMIDAFYTFNLVKGGHLLGGRGPLRLAYHTFKSLYTTGLLPIVLALFAGAALVLMQVGWSKLREDLHRYSLEVVIFFWLALELADMLVNGGMSYHSFPVLPPAVLAGTWFVSAASQLPATRRSAAVAIALAVLFLPPAIKLVALRPKHMAPLDETLGLTRLTADIARRTRPEDTLFSLSVEGANVMNTTGRLSSSPYLTRIALMTKGYASDRRWWSFQEQFETHLPKLIIVEKYGWNGAGNMRDLVGWAWDPARYANKEEEDSTLYPGFLSFLDFVGQHYRIDYCVGAFYLAEQEPKGEAIPSGTATPPENKDPK